MFPSGTTWARAFLYGRLYGEDSSPLRIFEGFKLVTNLKETKEAKCKTMRNSAIRNHRRNNRVNI